MLLSQDAWSQSVITRDRKESSSKKQNPQNSRTTNGSKNNISVSSATGSKNGKEYVDLGLPSGTKWARTNIGATNPQAYGNYFAWAEVAPKTHYTKETCTYEGQKLNEITPDLDAATVNWGSQWQTPTLEQFKELKDKCKWTWVRLGSENTPGTYGYKVTGPNGNSIFLPAAGWKDDTKIDGENKKGSYWTKTIFKDTTPHRNLTTSCNIGLEKDYINLDLDMKGWAIPYLGRTIRPVTQ